MTISRQYSPERILHVAGNMDLGGAETLIMEIYRHADLNKIQFDFLVLSQREGAYDREIKDKGGTIHRVSSPGTTNPIQFEKDLYLFFSKNKYMVVHSHLNAMNGIILKQADKAGVPIRISHSHVANPKLKLFNRIYEAYSKRYILKCSTHRFACSELAGIYLYGGGEKDNYYIFPDAIDTKKFAFSNTTREQVRSELNISDRFVIGHVGRFAYPKNHNFVIEIFFEIQKIEKNAVLLLIGTGNLLSDIKKKVENMKLTKSVIFLGQRTDANNILQGLDIFLFPSIYEGFGIAVIEAQCSGLKVFASNRIPKETNLTDSIEYIPLEKEPSFWAEKIAPYTKGYARKDNTTIIRAKNYDIYSNTAWLQNLYIEEIKKYR